MNFSKKIKEHSSSIFSVLTIAIATCGVYSNTLKNEFLWDDEFLIQKNEYIKDIKNIGEIFTSSSTEGFGGTDSFYRPMQIFMYTIIHSIAGPSTEAFHIGNIFLHLINALLLFFVIRRIFKRKLLAFITAFLWAIHPVHTEAITYVSGTADPLSVLFILLSSYFYLRARQDKKTSWLTFLPAVLSFILALLSKESVIIFPGLLMTIDALKSKDRYKWGTYKWTLPFWAISLTYFFLRSTLLNFDKSFEFYKTANIYTENIHYRIFTFLAAFVEYLKIFFFPADLHMERAFPVFVSLKSPQVFCAALIILCCIIMLWVQRKKDTPLFSFSFFWFFIAFFPMSGILIPVNSFLLEHWLYLPSISLFLLIAALIVKIYDLNQVTQFFSYSAVFAITIALSFLTYTRNTVWKDPITFYNNILSHNEGTARVHNNLAMAYSSKDDDKAIEHYLKAIELSDSYPQTHYNLARAYIRAQNYEKAKKHLNRSLEINPKFKWALELQEKLDDFLRKRQAP